MAKRKYDIVEPVEHDGERFETGQIELAEVDAEPLLAVGAIAEPKKGKAKDAEG